MYDLMRINTYVVTFIVLLFIIEEFKLDARMQIII